MVGVLCGCRAAGVGLDRPEQSGGEGTAAVSMSVSDSGSGSLVAMLLMFVFVSISSGASCMVVGGGVFWESSPSPISAEASSPLYRLAIGV